MKRSGRKAHLRRLRVAYRRARGRHDRCWDNVYEGKWALRNTLRVEMNRANLEFWRAMGFRIWRAGAEPYDALYDPYSFVIEYLGPGKGYR